MTATLLDRLAERLRGAPVGIGAATPLAVALSGGVDSVVLLAAVHRIGASQALRCIHVDHQLHADSADWARFCREFAAQLGVEFRSCVVQCESHGAGVEAAARNARYAVLAAELRPGEVLLTAHHADDQLETLVYRLVRGTGVDGLRGIRAFETFGRGYLMRPLLEESRAAILEQAQAMGLRWREDPSNADTRFDRNYLRLRVLPSLLERWPHAGQAAARFAAAARDSAELAETLAQADLEGVAALDQLPLARLAALTPARRRNVARYAIRRLGLPVPDAGALERLCALTEPAAQDSAVVAWPGAEARRYAPSLYLQRSPPKLPGHALALQPDQPCALGDGRLELVRAPAPALPDEWVRAGLSVRFRAGGEQFQPAGAARPQPLREWLRTRAVLPWMRERLPLVYRGAQLVAVADLGVSEAAAVAAGAEGGWRVVWHDRPRTHAEEAADGAPRRRNA